MCRRPYAAQIDEHYRPNGAECEHHSHCAIMQAWDQIITAPANAIAITAMRSKSKSNSPTRRESPRNRRQPGVYA